MKKGWEGKVVEVELVYRKREEMFKRKGRKFRIMWKIERVWEMRIDDVEGEIRKKKIKRIDEGGFEGEGLEKNINKVERENIDEEWKKERSLDWREMNECEVEKRKEEERMMVGEGKEVEEDERIELRRLMKDLDRLGEEDKEERIGEKIGDWRNEMNEKGEIIDNGR